MSRVERTIAFVLPAGLGASAAVFAIVVQSGYTRGYSSLGFLFVIVLVAFALAIAGVVILLLGKKYETAILMFAAAFTLPASFLSILFLVRKYHGE